MSLHHLIIIVICLISNSLLIKLNSADNNFDSLDFQESEKFSTKIDTSTKSIKDKPKPQWRIVNGAHAEPGLFPWQLQLQRNFRKHCGATLIKPGWAVTAAHCVATSERMDVMIGSTHWNGGERVGVERAIIHPEYDRRRFLNDIAILKLSSGPTDESNSASINLDTFSSSNLPSHQTSSLYSDNKNVFDISQLTSSFPSLGSSSLYGSSSTDSNFPNLPLDSTKTSSDDSITSTLLQADSHNSIWGDENNDEKELTETSSFFKKKKSKSDWFFDSSKQPINFVESQIDDKYDDMNNNRIVNDKKKKSVSEYFKIRARNSLENETPTAIDKKSNETIIKNDNKLKNNKEKYRNTHEFEATSIKIPEYFMQFKGTATVVGWGLVSESDRVGTDHLMAANVRILDNEKCKNYKNFEDDTQICAGYSNGGVDACAGDSGGGLVTMVKESPFLIGIVSYGLGCGRKNFPGVYTKVSHYRDWIEAQTGY